jgi:D-tyrosyl-tRNA(Tyr) deacylase
VRAVVQRVSRAKVTVDGEITGEIARGFVVLLGVAEGDTQADVIYMLVVSQFTLLGDCRKGRRPSFIAAARPEVADALYRSLIAEVQGQGIFVATGRFQTHMDVELVNDGPVTLLIDSRKDF